MPTELTRKQVRFIAALLQGNSVTSAAESAGIKRRTAYRYLAQENVQRELRERGSAVLVASQARLAALLDLAQDALLDALQGKNVSIGKRWAAGAVLRHCVRLMELLNLEARVTALEDRLGGER